MTSKELEGLVEFLQQAERLKDMTRTSWTSQGRQESVAAHTWRLCLMAVTLRSELPEVDFARLLSMCVVHDLGEAISGDIPAIYQDDSTDKSANERRDLHTLLEPLPPRLRESILELWEEYESAKTPEAKLAKGLDKLETILQHNQGKNPEDFDYRFNLGYGREFTADDPLIVALRTVLDRQTEARARESEPAEDGS